MLINGYIVPWSCAYFLSDCEMFVECPHDTGHLESRVRFIIGLEISLGLAPKTVFYYAYVRTNRRVILELGLRYWYRCLETGA